jgi:hypothetical protein
MVREGRVMAIACVSGGRDPSLHGVWGYGRDAPPLPGAWHLLGGRENPQFSHAIFCKI